MESTNRSLHDFIRDMPKVELHVHLEGSIRPATLLALAERNHVPLPARDLAGLREFYHFTDLEHFVKVYFTISGCLKTVQDFSLIAYEFGAEMAWQRICAEVDVYALYERRPGQPTIRREHGRAEGGAGTATPIPKAADFERR